MSTMLTYQHQPTILWRCVCYYLMSILIHAPTPILTYRLNVPNILLPAKVDAAVNFTLDVSDPEGGCFTWRSTKPDVATVSPILSNSDANCSAESIVSVAWTQKQPMSTVVFAEDKASGILLRCDVLIDDINNIQVETTTRKLYIDDAPVQFAVRAINAKDDKFTALDGVEFEWAIKDKNVDGSAPILHLLPFSESKYETPPAIERLELAGKQGHVVLVDGLNTGTSQLTVRLAAPAYAHVAPHSIDLLVVASLHLYPGDVYVPVHAVIKYRLEVFKQNRFEIVKLPSPQYFLSVTDDKIVNFDEQTSSVLAKKLGKVNVVVNDRNVGADTVLSSVDLPMSKVHVVSPATLHFSIQPHGVWIVEVGRTYEVAVLMHDAAAHHMMITDNMRFTTTIPLAHFDVLHKSANGSYFVVKALKSGHTRLQSTYNGVVDTNNLLEADNKIKGEQPVDIYDPIRVLPEIVVFPWDPVAKARYQYQLKAEGGSGSYQWWSRDQQVVVVNEHSGAITTQTVGSTSVRAADAKQRAHHGHAQVHITPPVRLGFGVSHREAEVHTELQLSVLAFGNVPGVGEHAFTDCRKLKMEVTLEKNDVFELLSDPNRVPESPSTGCATISLSALKSGDTRITIAYRLPNTQQQLSATTTISAFNPLKLLHRDNDQVHMSAVGGVARLAFVGGPRPWLLDTSEYYATLTASTKDITPTKLTGGAMTYELKCPISEMVSNLHGTVGNRPTKSNPLPVESKIDIKLCCSIPDRVWLQPQLALPDQLDLPACPIVDASSDPYPLYFGDVARVSAHAVGRCTDEPSSHTRAFDDFTSLILRWKTSDSQLLTVDNDAVVNTDDTTKNFITVTPHQRAGTVELKVITEKYLDSISCSLDYAKKYPEKCLHNLPRTLSSSCRVRLSDHAQVTPKQITVFNHPQYRAKITVKGGSGHFHVLPNYQGLRSIASTEMTAPHKLTITPVHNGQSVVRVIDLCMRSAPSDCRLHVSDIDRIEIDAPELVELTKQIPLKVTVYDEYKQPFNNDVYALMKLKLNIDTGVLGITENSPSPLDSITSQHSTAIGERVGNERLVATAVQANGHVVRSPAHRVQVFAPLKLDPTEITLVVATYFQLEPIGGPQPSPDIYSLNDTSIATVSDNGLIETLHLGHALVTGVVMDSTQNVISEAHVYLHVIQLTGVRIHVPTTHVYTNVLLPMYVCGTSTQVTPFSFGGRRQRYVFHWTVDNDNARVVSPFESSSITENDPNKFAIRLRTVSVGHVNVKVKVSLSSDNSVVFTDNVRISIVNPLTFTQPNGIHESMMQHVLMAPNSKMVLQLNSAQIAHKYSVVRVSDTTSHGQSHTCTTVSVDQNGLMRSAGISGRCMLHVRALTHDTHHNETLAVMVEVLPVSYLLISDVSDLPVSGTVSMLPISANGQLQVTAHDSYGRRLHTNSAKLTLRLHRFDLTELTNKHTNGSAAVLWHSHGDTVLKAWDETQPKVADFIRMPVGDVIKPSARKFVVGDIVKFDAPFDQGVTWSSSDVSVMSIDAHTGVAHAYKPGTTQITCSKGTMLITKIKITIQSIDSLVIGDQPWSSDHVTNAKGSQALVSVVLQNKRSVHGSKITKWSGMKITPPFTCSIEWQNKQDVPAHNLFSVAPIFDNNIESYACQMKVLPFDGQGTQFGIIDDKIVLTVQLTDDANTQKTKYQTIISYYGEFTVNPVEFILDNKENMKTTLSIRASSAVHESITVTPSMDRLLHVSKAKRSSVQSDMNRVDYTIRVDAASDTVQYDGHTARPPLGLVVQARIGTHTQRVIVPVHLRLYTDGVIGSPSLLDWLHQLWFGQMKSNLLFIVLLLVVTVVAAVVVSMFCMAWMPQLIKQRGDAAGGPIATSSPVANGLAHWRSPNTSGLSTRGAYQNGSASSGAGAGGMDSSSPMLWSTDRAQLLPTTSRSINSGLLHRRSAGGGRLQQPQQTSFYNSNLMTTN